MTELAVGPGLEQPTPPGRVVRGMMATAVFAGMLSTPISGIGTTNAAMPITYARAVGLGIDFTTAYGSVTSSDAEPPSIAAEHVVGIPEQVRRLRDYSGLTWDQIAKLFGVSRRSVHLWASGKRMNAGHEKTLFDLLSIVDRLPASSADARRVAMLRPGPNRPSIYDQFRMDRADAEVIERSSFAHISDGE